MPSIRALIKNAEENLSDENVAAIVIMSKTYNYDLKDEPQCQATFTNLLALAERLYNENKFPQSSSLYTISLYFIAKTDTANRIKVFKRVSEIGLLFSPDTSVFAILKLQAEFQKSAPTAEEQTEDFLGGLLKTAQHLAGLRTKNPPRDYRSTAIVMFKLVVKLSPKDYSQMRNTKVILDRLKMETLQEMDHKKRKEFDNTPPSTQPLKVRNINTTAAHEINTSPFIRRT